MFAILPAVVGSLYFAFACYLAIERGIRPSNRAFLFLCLLTAVWQMLWAVLFLVPEESTAVWIARAGYMPILFLPTALYQVHVVEARSNGDLPWVHASYILALVLAIVNLSTDWFIAGVHARPWGWYPKAGILHPIHVAQTMAAAVRAIQLSVKALRASDTESRSRMRVCTASVAIYSLAAVDYLCNYGATFYPFGIVFLTTSLVFMAVGISRHNLMSEMRSAVIGLAGQEASLRTSMSTAATMAHEMRNALANFRMTHSLIHSRLDQASMTPRLRNELAELVRRLESQAESCRLVIDLTLAACRSDRIDTATFSIHPMAQTVEEALDNYPFTGTERRKLALDVSGNFNYYGAKGLLVFVFFNLLKNALDAIAETMRTTGTILVTVRSDGTVEVRDNGCGMNAEQRAQAFDPFYSTKGSRGMGVGLTFCKRVVDSFGGSIGCESQPGEYTLIRIRLPVATDPASETPEAEPNWSSAGSVGGP